jgi:uncharacterized SAM-binding protein YcdF (DUF218 family)
MGVFRGLAWFLAVTVAIVLCLIVWGGNLLIASDPLPEHVKAAIVLQGSMLAEKARLGAAINLLQRGVADRVLLSVPKESYWGQAIPPVARAYIERSYGQDLAARVEFCETSEEVNSTAQEAQALTPCIQQHHWESILFVTSNYHTRRAAMIWKRALKNNPEIRIWIDGVADPEFQQPWWRYRRSAKIWLSEVTKLSWTVVGGR